MTAAVAPTKDELPPVGVDRPVPIIEQFRQPPIRPLPLDQFLQLDVKPRAQLLAPLFPEKGLAMVYAPRGMGKTFLALGIAYAVASGGSVLRWRAPAPRRVLYIDGEMPLATIQERLSSIVAGSKLDPAPEDFQILAADYFADGLPSLATPGGQAAIEQLLDGVALVVIDNISTLAAIGHDNDAESWTPVQGWLLRLRRKGVSVLLVHHAGKGGQQRGTSRREDVLDTVIALRRPSDYNPTEGARFDIHVEKARGAYGDDVKPFEAKLEMVDGGATWSTRDLADADLARVISLANEGLSIRDGHFSRQRGALNPRHCRRGRHVEIAGPAAQEAGRGRRPRLPEGLVMTDKKAGVPLSQPLGRGTVGQSPDSRDTTWDSVGTPSLKALARNVLQRDTARDSRGTAADFAVPGPSSAWDSPGEVSQEPLNAVGADDLGERAAMVEYGAGVPRAWAEGFARLDLARPPAGFSARQWAQLIDDGGRFLDRWAAEAAAAGWDAADVFGVHPLAPNANYSLAGLVPLICGGEVIALKADRASVQRRQGATLTYLRRQMVGAVAIWELASRAA